MSIKNFAQLSWAWKKFYNLGTRVPLSKFYNYPEYRCHKTPKSYFSQEFGENSTISFFFKANTVPKYIFKYKIVE